MKNQASKCTNIIKRNQSILKCTIVIAKVFFPSPVPGKVTNVTNEGLGVVANGKIHQVISWSTPPHHTSELNYTIKYELIDRENQSQSSAMTIIPKRQSVNLTLPTTNRPQQTVMYYVSVAAVSDAGQGQFSNKIALTYEGKNQSHWLHFMLRILYRIYTALQKKVTNMKMAANITEKAESQKPHIYK